ncbi:hypothetical protein [Dyella sp. ASV21]|uniref:hypothetical protein n=1 Tax=Dyella sp. ASV21 TaxID=2795114 RepID=UPI0018EB8675|nr:hypothetical protein [Dyella sp. ASV21]
MSDRTFSLHQLGWRPEFAASLTLTDFEAGYPARVMAEHAGLLTMYSSRGCHALAWPEGDAVPGDWLLLDRSRDHVMARLPRQSLYHDPSHDLQNGVAAIANLRTLCLVTSCAADVNNEALARCIGSAKQAHVTPVLVLVRETARVDASVTMVVARRRYPGVSVVNLAIGDVGSRAALAPWIEDGGALFVAAPSHDDVSIRGARWLETLCMNRPDNPLRVTPSAAWVIADEGSAGVGDAGAARATRWSHREMALTYS